MLLVFLLTMLVSSAPRFADGGTIVVESNEDPVLNLTSKCEDCLLKLLSRTKCHDICGCDKGIDKENPSTELNVNELLITNLTKVKEVEVTQDHDIMNDEGIAKRIRLEADRIFQGIIISLILFMTCASICFITACVYCCRMSYQDRKLRSDVKALAKKLKRDYHSKRSIRKKPLPPISESCNVVVGEAGVFVC